MSAPAPTIRPTTPGQVVASVLVGFTAAWLVLWTLQGQGVSLPLVGPLAWFSVLLIAGGIVTLTVRTRREVRDRPDTLDASVALTRLLLGKTSVLAGAVLGGAYAALVVLVLPALPAPLAVERLAHGGVAVVACLVWSLAGWALQRALRIPPEDPDDSADTPGDADGPGRRPPVA